MVRWSRVAPTPGAAVETAVNLSVLSGGRMQATRPKHPFELAVVAFVRRADRMALLWRALKMTLVCLATLLMSVVAPMAVT